MNLVGTKEIETERLLLRKIKTSDYLAAYNNWCSNPNVSLYLPWDVHKDMEETHDLFKMWEEDYIKDDVFRWIVEVKDTHTVIGTIDVVGVDLKAEVCEVGYCYSEEYWHKGYASEALKAVIDYLFSVVDCYLVCAKHYSLNPNSGLVMKKCGMKKDGVLRDRVVDSLGNRSCLVCYSITKDEYMRG